MSPRRPLRGDEPMELSAFRLPKEMLREIDAFAERLSARKGIAVQRAEAARILIAAGLRSEKGGKSTGRKGR